MILLWALASFLLGSRHLWVRRETSMLVKRLGTISRDFVVMRGEYWIPRRYSQIAQHSLSTKNSERLRLDVLRSVRAPLGDTTAFGTGPQPRQWFKSWLNLRPLAHRSPPGRHLGRRRVTGRGEGIVPRRGWDGIPPPWKIGACRSSRPAVRCGPGEVCLLQARRALGEEAEMLPERSRGKNGRRALAPGARPPRFA